jgi:hypothetical protein
VSGLPPYRPPPMPRPPAAAMVVSAEPTLSRRQRPTPWAHWRALGWGVWGECLQSSELLLPPPLDEPGGARVRRAAGGSAGGAGLA